ncbi:pyridoxamine 5'-phosphate oxidase family protein [bacterium AH-315-C20]|nr:pyridoxamine 5'-phosphate oxidase family protein [bacterium AH-315-C20]
MITDEMLPALQGAVPSALVTCNKEGIPNATYISQVFYVSESEVALSFQFFNKTVRNVRENPHASIKISHPEKLDMWELEIEFNRSETEGDLFDQMDMQLEAIASMTGMADVFKLQAADVYKVHSVKKCDHLVKSS